MPTAHLKNIYKLDTIIGNNIVLLLIRLLYLMSINFRALIVSFFNIKISIVYLRIYIKTCKSRISEILYLLTYSRINIVIRLAVVTAEFLSSRNNIVKVTRSISFLNGKS